MANMPIERERSGGLPWWAWLLLALAALLLLLFLLRGCENEDDPADAPAADTTAAVDGGLDPGGAAAVSGPVLVLDELYARPGGASSSAPGAMGGTPADLVGREVSLTDAPVLSVVGDSSFYVGAADDRRVLVVLEGLGEGAQGSGDGDDGRFDIDTGDRVSIRGTVQRFGAATRGVGGVDPADREALAQDGIYVRVDRASDVSATAGAAGTDPTRN